MRVTVFGAGYVGTVVAVALAETGNDVLCVDNDTERLKMLHAGEVPFHERGLAELLLRNVNEGRLNFTGSAEEGALYGEVIFIAVGTPQGCDGRPDLNALFDVVRSIAEFADGSRIVVIKSTVPVGTAKRVKHLFAQLRPDARFSVVSNPEFMKEGTALTDFMKPSRVVLGSDDEGARATVAELYEPFMRVSKRIFFCGNETAEMIKYASNAFLATKISFINEIANICELVGADIDLVRLATGADPRIGPHFLFPGVGFGGSCLPKDLDALILTAEDAGYTPQLIKAVKDINERQWLRLMDRISRHFKNGLRGLKAAVWGLAFKPETDDVRNAPAIKLINALLGEGVSVAAYDPAAMGNAEKLLGESVTFGNNMYDVLDGADFLLLVTEWHEFRHPDFKRVRSLMRQHIIFDGRNIYNSYELRKKGFIHYFYGGSVGGNR